MSHTARRDARAEAVYRLLEDGTQMTNPQIMAACNLPNSGITKRAIKDAAVLAKAAGKCLIFPTPEAPDFYSITSNSGAITRAPSHFLRKVEDGVRNRRLELDEFAMKHTADMSREERRLLRLRVEADRKVEEARAASTQYVSEMEDQLGALRMRLRRAEAANQ